MAKQWLYTLLRIGMLILSLSALAIAGTESDFEQMATEVIQDSAVSSNAHTAAMTEKQTVHCSDIQNLLECDLQCGNCVSCAIAPPDLALYAIDRYPVTDDYHKNLVFADLDQQLKPPRV